MEEEFNFNNNILKIDLMQFVEIGINTPKEQYGRRKKKIHYAHFQQTTDLRRDTLTTAT